MEEGADIGFVVGVVDEKGFLEGKGRKWVWKVEEDVDGCHCFVLIGVGNVYVLFPE